MRSQLGIEDMAAAFHDSIEEVQLDQIGVKRNADVGVLTPMSECTTLHTVHLFLFHDFTSVDGFFRFLYLAPRCYPTNST